MTPQRLRKRPERAARRRRARTEPRGPPAAMGRAPPVRPRARPGSSRQRGLAGAVRSPPGPAHGARGGASPAEAERRLPAVGRAGGCRHRRSAGRGSP